MVREAYLVPAAAERIAAGAQHEYGYAGSQKHGLELQPPAAVGSEVGEMPAVGQKQGEQHIDDDKGGSQACVNTQYQQQRSQHFTQVNAPGQKRRQATHSQHGLDAADAVLDFGPAMEKNQYAKHQAQQQPCKIVERILGHTR